MKSLTLLLLAASLPLTACSKKEDALGTSIAAAPAAEALAPTPAPAVPAADGSAALAGGTGKAQWTAPPTWTVEAPASSMRVAQWELPAPAGKEAECAMFHFSGGGGVDDNINRWIRQFDRPGTPADGSGSPPDGDRAILDVNGVKVTMARTQGTFKTQGVTMAGPVERKENYALFAAIFEAPGDPYFLKCVGHAEVIAAEEKAMVGLVNSFIPKQ
jgi:hypothetical protein